MLKETSNYKVRLFFFYLTLIRFYLIFGTLDFLFFRSFFLSSHWFSQKRTVSFDFVAAVFFYVWNYWLHNGLVKIERKATKERNAEKVSFRKKVHDFSIER